MRAVRPVRRRPRGEDGATAVEFAIVLPLLLTLVFTILAFGLHLTYAAVAEHSVREGLREATARKNKQIGGVFSSTYGDVASVRSRVDETAPGFLPKATTVTCTVTVRVTENVCASDRGGMHQGEQVTVTATYAVPGVTAALQAVPFLGSSLSSLSTVKRSATGRRE